jgi:DNA (cytosine-5)-methyltransferase 1
MKFGSVCSGIEAASVAWGPLGWKAAWLSEIEPFPSAVLAHHYPDVPNLGDMTTLPERILSGEVEAPDVFCGGTPCQAFSVAGLRNSLDDARGNLSLTFVGIANAIDNVRSARGEQPAIVFWENVPGVLSTKDNAFGCFISGLAGEEDPVEPPRGKWTNAGVVLGPQRTVAWRVLDAQYFGVAQRRRRVFVVASSRDDFDPASVLFEFDSVRRDTAPSRETGQAIAPSTGASVKDGVGTVQTLRTRRPGEGGMSGDDEHLVPVISPALNTCSGSHHAPNTKAYVVHPVCGQNGKDIAGTITAGFGGSKMGGPEVDAGLYIPISIHPVGSLCARTGQSISVQDADQGHLMAVAQPIPINSMNAFRSPDADPTTGCGIGEAGEAMFTITKTNSHAVAQPMVLMDQGGSVMNVEHDMVGTLRRETHGHEPVVMQPVTYAETAQTLTAGYEFDYNDEKKAASHIVGMQVRRLTPVECERLQGFPDNYTNIPWRKKDESPDGPRYKALGNSWAVPNVRWIGQRIQENLK